jgi:hypothetical protein
MTGHPRRGVIEQLRRSGVPRGRTQGPGHPVDYFFARGGIRRRIAAARKPFNEFVDVVRAHVVGSGLIYAVSMAQIRGALIVLQRVGMQGFMEW